MVAVRYRAVALAAFMAMTSVGAGAVAGTYKVLHQFAGAPNDGASPSGSLMADSAGNLYGTTVAGGAANLGTVYKLSPPTKRGGDWTETILFSFGRNGGLGGTTPQAGLIMDPSGNLYGTAQLAGKSSGVYGDGYGVAFKLSPPAAQGGQWTETVLYEFGQNKHDGRYPLGPLTMDANGALYGTTYTSDVKGMNVFKLTAPVSGTGPWTEQILYFGPYVGVGAGLIIDDSGRIYGVDTYRTFRLTPPTAGELYYKFSSIFAPTPVGSYSNQNSGFTMDSSLNLYVSSNYGVYKLRPPESPDKTWLITWLYSFGSAPPDGSGPVDSPSFDALGNLYYVTYYGGIYDDGALLRLEPPRPEKGAGKDSIWSEILVRSGTQGPGGSRPSGGVIFDQAGNSYGTMQNDGIQHSNAYSCCGVVYEWVKS